MIKLKQIRQWTNPEWSDDIFLVVYVGEKSAVIKYYNGADESLESFTRLENESVEIKNCTCNKEN